MSELKRTLIEDVFYPKHDPRVASNEYRGTHKRLVVDMDEPCWICGVRNSDVAKMPPAGRKLWQLETHHAELEWAAEKAFEGDATMLRAITADFPAILDNPEKLRDWLDSEGDMTILCAMHHRGARTGIHSITYPAWKLQRYQFSPGAFQFVPQPTAPPTAA